MRRKLILGVAALLTVLPNTGCLLLNQYDSEPTVRTSQLLNHSEDLRQAREEWRRFWLNNQPSVLTYERLNGAIGP